MRIAKLRKCSYCGMLFIPQGRGRKTCSFECALAAMQHQISEMRQKHGPGYEHWLKGMADKVEAELALIEFGAKG